MGPTQVKHSRTLGMLQIYGEKQYEVTEGTDEMDQWELIAMPAYVQAAEDEAGGEE